MANLKSSKKAIRVIKKRTDANRSSRSKIRTFIRKVSDALNAENTDDAKKAFLVLESEIMKSVSKGIYKKNTASRKLSRMAKMIRKKSKK